MRCSFIYMSEVGASRAASGIPSLAEWTHPYPRALWTPTSDPRSLAAFNAGMTVPPFEPCTSMSRRMPHMKGLVLVEALKPVYFMNGGEKKNFAFTDADDNWLLVRHERNQRDEDVSREDYVESLMEWGYQQAARADACVKQPSCSARCAAGNRLTLSAATLIESLEMCHKDPERRNNQQIALSVSLGVMAFKITSTAPDDFDIWMVKEFNQHQSGSMFNKAELFVEIDGYGAAC